MTLDADLVLAIETLMSTTPINYCKIEKLAHHFWVLFYLDDDVLGILVEVTKKQTYIVCKNALVMYLAKQIAIDTGWPLTDWDDIPVEV